MSRALFTQFPQLLGRTPFIELATLPTPVETAPQIAARSGLESVWVKRDDLTATIYGGNKVRKLEFLLGDARKQRAHEVFTVGAIGSQHALATSLFAKAHGFRVSVHHVPQPPTVHVRRNCLALAATGATLRLGPVWSLPVALLRARLRSRLRHDGTYVITIGGSSPVGCLGYVNAALELVEQVRQGELPDFDHVYLAVGSTGTMAGLLVGFRLANYPVQVVGVRVADRIVVNAAQVAWLAHRTAERLRRQGLTLSTRFGRADVVLDHSQFGAGYGNPTASGQEAVDLAASCGLYLDLTYTGKALAGLIATARQRGARTVLFLNSLSSASVQALIPEGFGPERLPAAYQRYFRGDPAA